jgi:sodium/proline symporter
MILASFLAALALFLFIGLASAAKSRGTKDDYYLASRSVPPAMAGLSAVATNNSGYMFIGQMGFTYAVGLASVWLMIGWILGDFLISLVVHRQLRQAAARHQEVTFAGVLARWSGGEYAVLRKVAALVTLVFLGAYAAAQLTAGGKTLQALFGWQPQAGAMLVAVMVALYCLAGGIRASIWTDVAQSAVMVVAMAAMLVAGLAAAGGIEAAWHSLQQVPGYLDLFPKDLLVPGVGGAVLFVTGWMFAGISVIGQPHIMVRFMALDSPGNLARARAWYYGFYVIFYAMALGVGLLARLLLPELGALDPELTLPTMALELLPPLFVGIVLAGIFAATMSTADSLVLSCSSALTHDLLPRRLERTLELKAATLAVVVLALAIALNGTQSVFVLVILAWSALASAFGPLMYVYARGYRATEWQAITMMAVGLAAALGWRALGLQDMVYEGLPGMLAGWATYHLTRPWAALPAAEAIR